MAAPTSGRQPTIRTPRRLGSDSPGFWRTCRNPNRVRASTTSRNTGLERRIAIDLPGAPSRDSACPRIQTVGLHDGDSRRVHAFNRGLESHPGFATGTGLTSDRRRPTDSVHHRRLRGRGAGHRSLRIRRRSQGARGEADAAERRLKTPDCPSGRPFGDQVEKRLGRRLRPRDLVSAYAQTSPQLPHEDAALEGRLEHLFRQRFMKFLVARFMPWPCWAMISSSVEISKKSAVRSKPKVLPNGTAKLGAMWVWPNLTERF